MIRTESRLSEIYRRIRKRITSADLILLSAGVFILFVNPAVGIFSPGCLFRKATGFLCAGCGMSRGIYSLLRGNFTSAAHYNLLLVTAVPVAAGYIVCRKYILKRHSRIGKPDKIIISLFIAAVILFTVFRNIFPGIL